MPIIDCDLTELSDGEFRSVYEKSRLVRSSVINELSRVLFSSIIPDSDKLQYSYGWLKRYYATLVK